MERESIQAPTQTERDLRAIVARHDVRYATYPDWGPDEHWQQRKVGFNLELTGTHFQPSHPPEPGCDECWELYANLKRIAEAILPTEHRPSGYEIEPFDARLAYERKRHSKPEVTLTIRIYHREHVRDPIDVCEQRCLAEMRAKLAELGAREA